jgi:gas vesicle protein
MLIKASSAAVTAAVSFAAGCAVGVLYAPATGVRTRRRLLRTSEELADKAAEVKESAEDLLDRTRHRIA